MVDLNFIDAIKKQDYFEQFITRNTYHSNGIEGNTLSYADTYSIIFNDNSFKITAEPREIYEAINHKYALNRMIEAVLNDDELSTELIIDIATIINKNIRDISGYRKTSVLIRGAEYVPPAPAEVPTAMMYYVYNYNNDNRESLFEKIADYHIRFERIHPFEDGNGRTGRLLLNYELIREGKAPIVIEKEQRSQYFGYLERQDIQGLGKLIEQLSIKEQELIDQVCAE